MGDVDFPCRESLLTKPTTTASVISGRPTTLIEILRDRVKTRPHNRIYTFLQGDAERSLTHKQLDEQARALGARLQQICNPGDRALLLHPPGLDYIVALFACMYAGVIAVPSYLPRPNRPLSRLESIVANAEPSVALTTGEIARSPRSVFHQAETSLAQLRVLITDETMAASPRDVSLSQTNSETPILLQYTSGSTASPKGVILSHANIIHNTAMIEKNFPLSTESSTVFWLPPYHDMGLIGGILQPLCTGFPVYLMSPVAFLQRPARWLEAISRYRATCSGGPNFAYDLCVRRISEEEMSSLDLSSWTVAFNGAEPIREQTLEDFSARFRACGFRAKALHPCYGLAEASLMVTGKPPGGDINSTTVSRQALELNLVEPPRTEDDGCVLVSSGEVVGDQAVRIVDPAKCQACATNHIGEVWVSGPCVAQGYWGKAEETQEVFRAHIGGESKNFLRTGDLGFLRDGELYITGRIKDLIIIHGQNHYPSDIEFTVSRSHASLPPSGTAAFSVLRDGIERLIIVQEFEGRHVSPDLAQIIAIIRQRVNQTHDLQVHDIVPVRVWTIPRTTSGKIQRYLCRAAYVEETLTTLK
jgi:acyl-CoA synthetase (AMP-forming)/AMP-acid ligase II